MTLTTSLDIARMRLRPLSLLLLSLAPTLACSSSSSTPATYTIAGSVTLNEKPVAGAQVQYHPTNADDTPLTGGAIAVGGQATTTADGSYAIECTFDRGKTTVRGLPAGRYAVTIVKMELPAGPASLDRPPKNALEPRYGSIDSTPVHVTIPLPDGNHNLDIPL